MERTEVLAMMGELRLYGMKNAYDELLATAVKRQHEPQRFAGDLLKAEISEKQARSRRAAAAEAPLDERGPVESVGVWKFRSGRPVSRRGTVAQRPRPEEQDNVMTAVSAGVRTVDGVRWAEMSASLGMIGDRSPWRMDHATTGPEVSDGRGDGDHGPMARRGDSARTKSSRP